MPRRRWAAAAGLAVAGAVGIVVATSGDDDATDALAGYSIDYDVEVFLPEGREVSTREVRVRRPFAGLDLRFDEDGRAVSGAIGDGGAVATVQPGALLDSGEGAPGVPPGDVRFDAVLDDLVRLGLLEAGGSATVAGRACTTYRSGAPLGDPLRPASPDEFVDWCIDDDGLLLEERWQLDGTLLRTTTATVVRTTTPPVSAFDPPAGLEAEPNPIGTSTRTELPIDSPPAVGDAEYWLADGTVDGFELDSRWRVVASSNVSGVPDVQDIAFADVYVRGIDVIVVQHRETSVAGEPVTGVETVDAGQLGRAEVLLSERGTELQVAADEWLVTLRGTVGVEDLAAFAAELRPVSAR